MGDASSLNTCLLRHYQVSSSLSLFLSKSFLSSSLVMTITINKIIFLSFKYNIIFIKLYL